MELCISLSLTYRVYTPVNWLSSMYTSFDVGSSVFYSRLHHSQSLGLWASHLTSLALYDPLSHP